MAHLLCANTRDDLGYEGAPLGYLGAPWCRFYTVRGGSGYAPPMYAGVASLCSLKRALCSTVSPLQPQPIAIFHRIGSAPSPGHFGWVFSIAGGCPSPWLPVGWFLNVEGTFKGSNLRRGDGACLRIKRSSRATDSHLKCTRTPRGARPLRARRWPSRARPSHTDSTPLLGLGSLPGGQPVAHLPNRLPLNTFVHLEALGDVLWCVTQ